MGRGIKLSKTAIFNIVYHTFPESGTVTFNDGTIFPDGYTQDYIMGVGLDSLLNANHSTVSVEEVDVPVNVYLEEFESTIPTWNKEFTPDSSGSYNFSDPISLISNAEAGDIDLYAKWVQYISRRIMGNSYQIDRQGPVDLNTPGILIFSWSN